MALQETSSSKAFELPTYPYDRLDDIKAIAEGVFGSFVDLSVGTPVDPPPAFVPHLLATSGLERGYPSSVGIGSLRSAAVEWLGERFGVELAIDQVAATVGTKEFVASLPNYLRLMRPDRDVVLYPEVAYPTYRMGAELAGCRSWPVPLAEDGSMKFDELPTWVIDGALVLWTNYPSNPTGRNRGIEEAVKWARDRDLLLVSDECYGDYVWSGTSESALQYGLDGVISLHSLSKRSNLAGLRVGFYAGDQEVVRFLSEVRKHAGLMVPGPVQVVAAASLADEAHVQEQRRRYQERLTILSSALRLDGFEVEMPDGGFYLWFSGEDKGLSSGFELAAYLAARAGIVVSPGEFYGDAAKSYVRIAVVAPTDLIQLISSRLGG